MEPEDGRARDVRIFVDNLEDTAARLRPGGPLPDVEGADESGTVHCVVHIDGSLSAVTIVDGWWDAVGPHGVAAAVLSAYRFAQQKATAGRLVLARSGHPYHQPEPDLSTLFTSEPDRPLPPYDAPDFTDALLRKVNRAATILANIDRFTKLRDAPEPRTVTGPRGLFRVVLSGFSIVRAEVNAYGLRPSDAAELAADARDALLAARPSFQLHGVDR
jgi:hypothetical protein